MLVKNSAEMYSFPISSKLDILYSITFQKSSKGNFSPKKLAFLNHCIKITLDLCTKYLFEVVNFKFTFTNEIRMIIIKTKLYFWTMLAISTHGNINSF